MSIDDIMELARLKGRVIALEAELESEKAAMKALMTTPCSRLLRAERDEVTRLKAEVERLRKAGDAMANAIKWLPQTISDHHQQAWNAAKEGKQS